MMGLLLEKKIKELETQLTPLLVSPASEPAESTGDIQAKFGFLNNLLAREMEVNTQNKPEHLDHVAGRLALLEAAFHNWNNNHAYDNNNHLDDDVHDDDDDDDDDLILKAIIPDCSCTHSCLIDAADDDDEKEVQEENDKSESDEKFKRMEEEDDDDDGEKKEVFEKDGIKFCGFGGLMVVVVVVVLAVVMKIWAVEEEDFFVPT